MLYGLYGEGVPSRNPVRRHAAAHGLHQAQDGPQHPGADALEEAGRGPDTTDGEVFIYLTDIYRGLPLTGSRSAASELLRDLAIAWCRPEEVHVGDQGLL
jgi:hypothetical protein